MYYIEQDNKIVLFNDNEQELKDTLLFMPQYKDLEIQETKEGYTVYNYQLVTLEEAKELKKQEEHTKTMELKMTPLDFLKAIEQYGITYDMVKQFMEQNPLIERELRFCQNVYRKHPMLNELATYGITSGILDNIFIQANKKGE
jgi:hypothetical protein